MLGIRRKALKEVFPIIKWLPSYKPVWIVHDLIAGIVVGVVALPQVYQVICNFRLLLIQE